MKLDRDVESRSLLTRVVCCCTMTSKQAAQVVAIIDMVIFTLLLIFVTSVTLVLVTSPHTLKEAVFSGPLEEDLESFVTTTVQGFKGDGDDKAGNATTTTSSNRYRWYILGILITWCAAEVGFAILLFCGTRKAAFHIVRAWIFLIIIDCLFGMVVFIPLIAHSGHRAGYIGLAVLYYVYRLVCLWIVHEHLADLLGRQPWV